MMKKISYSVPLLKQSAADCVQASASQILSFYGIKKSIEEIKKEVPVYIGKDGKTLGSSLGHIAAYFVRLGLRTTLHSVDIEIFDRSWLKLDKYALIEKLRRRRKYLKHSRYDEPAMDVVVDGYIQFLERGGKIVFPIVDVEYFYRLLMNGPIYAVLSYNFLNQVAKYKFSSSGEPIQNSVTGAPSTHAVVVSGFKEEKFEITDPDYKLGGKKLIDPGLLVGSFYLAETDFDPFLITLAD